MSKELVEVITQFNSTVERALYERDENRHTMTFEEWQKKHSKFVTDENKEVL